MRAAVYERRGPASEVLEVREFPDPEPSEGEVRVRIHASGINPSDVKSRSGTSSGQSGAGDPLLWPQQIPHQDGSGVIDAVGSGVDPDRVGESVWVYNAAHERPSGTAAEYLCLSAQRAITLPDGVPMSQGAGIGIPFITAHRCLFADAQLAGATVLVTGGAGAVGHAAVQLARLHGADVIATVSSEEKAELARDAGARATVNYRADDADAQIRQAAARGIDRVVDVSLMSNLPSYVEALNPHAVVVAYAEIPGSPVPTWPPLMSLRVKNLTLRFVRAYGLTQPMQDHATADITAALREGELHSLPEHHFLLDQIVAAHEAVEDGVTGKVVVDLI